MKNVLFVCILSTLSFNQSIYTKQLTLNINAEDWESDVSQYTYLILNINDYLDLLEGSYKVELSSVLYEDAVYGNLYIDSYNSNWIDNNPCDNGTLIHDFSNVFSDSGNFKISPDCSDIEIAYSNYVPIDMEIKIWITGLFNDQNSGLQGDMNNDSIINVIDIVEIVNIIISE